MVLYGRHLGNGPSVYLYTDGCCLPEDRVGGWAFCVLTPNGAKHPHSGDLIPRYQRDWGGLRRTSNNRAELIAVIRGLKSLTAPTRVDLVTDSMYVIDGILNRLPKWKLRQWRTSSGSIRNASLWQQLDALLEIHAVTYRHVPAHSGNRNNELCDERARNAALQKQKQLAKKQKQLAKKQKQQAKEPQQLAKKQKQLAKATKKSAV